MLRGVDSSVPGALGARKCQLCSSDRRLSICLGWFWARRVWRRGRQERPPWGEGASLGMEGRNLKTPEKAWPCPVPQFPQLSSGSGKGMMLISQRLFRESFYLSRANHGPGLVQPYAVGAIAGFSSQRRNRDRERKVPCPK